MTNNKWLKKYLANIITIIIIAITVIATAAATSATIKNDISHLKTDVSDCQDTNAIQDECITQIRIQLGGINAKLDILLEKDGD